jgi:hypothetical protein
MINHSFKELKINKQTNTVINLCKETKRNRNFSKSYNLRKNAVPTYNKRTIIIIRRRISKLSYF